MIEINCEKGFEAREWNSKQGDKHNIYVKSSDGEIGWLDLQTGSSIINPIVILALLGVILQR